MGLVEQIARLLCERSGSNPDATTSGQPNWKAYEAVSEGIHKLYQGELSLLAHQDWAFRDHQKEILAAWDKANKAKIERLQQAANAELEAMTVERDFYRKELQIAEGKIKTYIGEKYGLPG